MSEDLIRRSDAISKTLCISFNGTPRMVVLLDDIKAIPSVDRPQGVWTIIRRGRTTTTVSCPNCGKHFHIPNYNFNNERRRWKCCPICETKMEGADDE